MKKYFSWYRSAVFLTILIPVVFCQTIYPIVPFETWERWSESLYPLFSQSSLSKSDSSSIRIIEIDRETERRYGWPLDRALYTKLLTNLKEMGHPWILSYLLFQKVGTTDAEIAKNRELAQSILDYKKYVGSSLTVWTDNHDRMSVDTEEELLPRALAGPLAKLPEDLPDFNLALDEDESFVKNQIKFGMGTRFGAQAVVYCTQLFIQDTNPKINVVIPTSMLWAAALFGQSNFLTSRGARSFFKDYSHSFNVASKHCLSSPKLDTADFLQSRKIETIPLYKIIEKEGLFDLKNKIVILADYRMKAHQGPGADIQKPGSGITNEHFLNARFLDDLLTKHAVRREPMHINPVLDLTPIVLSAAFTILSWMAPLPLTILLAGIAMIGMIAASIYSLSVSFVYFIPVPVFFYLIFVMIGLTIVYAYLSYHNIRRVVMFRDGIRRTLSVFQDYDSLAQGTEKFLSQQFDFLEVRLQSRFADLYAAASSHEKVAEYLARQKSNPEISNKPEPIFGCKDLGKFGFLASKRKMLCQFNAMSREEEIGDISLAVGFPDWERGAIIPIVDVLRVELIEQWSRVHRLVCDKVADYEALIRNTRTKILEKFLGQSLVDKFSDGRTMEENLRVVLNPRETYAAIFQADIRGYSTLFENQKTIDIVNLVVRYYTRTVDAAQKVAQVKLIGDCIFLFIEEKPDDEKSAADLALYLAAVLIRETEDENRRQAASGRAPIAFGIAIHFGEVVMGNLSSSSCIDYTVVGPNVNRTARMEELTKKPEIKELVGPNGLLISKEAEKALRYYRGKINPHHINLKEKGLAIRSFGQVAEISYLTAPEALPLARNAGEEAELLKTA